MVGLVRFLCVGLLIRALVPRAGRRQRIRESPSAEEGVPPALSSTDFPLAPTSLDAECPAGRSDKYADHWASWERLRSRSRMVA